jgi:predicted RNA binding protein YcfA (HicA-like mRNA interferase family)
MSRLLPVTGKQMCRIPERLGFVKVHQSGSHIRYIHPDGRRTVVPVHDNEKFGIGLTKEILKQVKLSRGDYEEMRQNV